jgi:hypothetical protein
MTELITIATASQMPTPPASIATPKMPSFPKNPPVGGTPARDTMNTVMPTASSGAVRISPAKSSSCRLGRRSDTNVTTANAPSVITA